MKLVARMAEETGGLTEFLPWLVEMGADEIILDAPVNRMCDASVPPGAVAEPVAAKPLISPLVQRQPTPPPRPRTAAMDEGTGDPVAAEAVAAAAATPAELQSAFAAFAVHPLAPTATRCCFLSGAAAARVLLLCDKPRNDEDPTGDVLAGKHRVLAERMLGAIGLCGMEAVAGLEQVMLASFVPWRPPGNRSVTETEALACVPFVRRLIGLTRPSLILCFGALPGHYLAGGDAAIPRARGQWLEVSGEGQAIPLLTTFHPETLLKSPQGKRLAWQDLQSFRRKLDELT
jgi:DNA polymerase